METPTYPEDWSPLDNRVLAHWEQFRPSLTRELRQQGTLAQQVHAAVSQALAAEQVLLDQGLDQEQAWELTRQDLFPLPDPPERPAPQT